MNTYTREEVLSGKLAADVRHTFLYNCPSEDGYIDTDRFLGAGASRNVYSIVIDGEEYALKVDRRMVFEALVEKCQEMEEDEVIEELEIYTEDYCEDILGYTLEETFDAYDDLEDDARLLLAFLRFAESNLFDENTEENSGYDDYYWFERFSGRRQNECEYDTFCALSTEEKTLVTGVKEEYSDTDSYLFLVVEMAAHVAEEVNYNFDSTEDLAARLVETVFDRDCSEEDLADIDSFVYELTSYSITRDVHSRNWGIMADGRLVILDYGI